MEAARCVVAPVPASVATLGWLSRLRPVQEIASAAIALVWPARCAVCTNLFAATGPHVCPSCSETFELQVLAPGEALDARWAAGLHHGALQESIIALKAQNQLWRARGLAGVAADVLARGAPMALPATIVAVPPSPKRLVVRGYDPVHHVARKLAASLGRDYLIGAMRRDDRLQKQAAAGRAERLASDGGWQVAARSVPDEVLLVDDVSTSGATLTACAARLRAAGCRRVIGFTLSAAPAPVRAWTRSVHGGSEDGVARVEAGGLATVERAGPAESRTIASIAHANLTADAPRC